MAKNGLALWNECLDEISQRVTPTQYKGFFEPIAFEHYDAKQQLLVIQVPSTSFVGYLEGAFTPLMQDVLGRRFGQSLRVRYHALKKVEEPLGGNAVEQEKPEQEPIMTNLNPQYTFTTFIEGESNRLARSVGQSIAEHPRSTKFNPMFVFGPSGCGKTHLINAIGLQTCAMYPKKKVLYVSAREFQRQYTDSILRKESNDFIHFYQQFDMLIVDDVQEWESSPKTAEAFFHIFNHLFMNGRRIILAADRTPFELKNMDERMLTRFACGILAEMEKPNLQLCIDILQAKIRRDGLAIPKDVVKYIAQNANGSVRELEGVINSLLAHSIFMTGEIDMALAEKVVGKIRKESPMKIDVNKIVDAVCEHYHVQVEDVLGASRRRELVLARQVSMYFLQHLGKVTVNRIGRLMGGRDHATVKHGIEKIVAAQQQSKDFHRELKELQRTIMSK